MVPRAAQEELVAWGKEVLAGEVYRAGLRQRLEAGTAPHIELYLFNRIGGKPKETLAVEGQGIFQTIYLGIRRDPLADSEERKALPPE